MWQVGSLVCGFGGTEQCAVTTDVDFEIMTVGRTLVTVNRVFVSLTVTRCGVTVRVGVTVVDLEWLRRHVGFYLRKIAYGSVTVD